jgi:hypothetical protein
LLEFEYDQTPETGKSNLSNENDIIKKINSKIVKLDKNVNR